MDTIAEFFRSNPLIRSVEPSFMKRVIDSTTAQQRIRCCTAVSSASTATLESGNRDFECIEIISKDDVDSDLNVS